MPHICHLHCRHCHHHRCHHHHGSGGLRAEVEDPLGELWRVPKQPNGLQVMTGVSYFSADSTWAQHPRVIALGSPGSCPFFSPCLQPPLPGGPLRSVPVALLPPPPLHPTACPGKLIVSDPWPGGFLCKNMQSFWKVAPSVLTGKGWRFALSVRWFLKWE